MWKFLGKIIVFSAPIALIFIFPACVWYYAREHETVKDIIATQKAHPDTLFGSAYVTPIKAYKKALLVSKTPEIVIVGTSRVFEFRESFFMHPDEFLNLGGIVGVPGDLSALAGQLSIDPDLKVVILGLDQRFFDPDFPDDAGRLEDSSTRLAMLKIFFSGAWRRAYTDWWEDKYTWHELAERSKDVYRIGLTALIKQEGFIADGSYIYHDKPGDPAHRISVMKDMELSVEDVRRDRGSFQYGLSIGDERLAQVASFLDAMQKRGIAVVGYLSPYSTMVGKEIDSVDDGFRSSKHDLPDRVAQVFAERGQVFFDLTDPATTGSSDYEFMDALHGTDKQSARITSYLAKRDQALARYVDWRTLDLLVASTKGDFLTR